MGNETKTTAPEVKAEVKEAVKTAATEAAKEVKAEVKEAVKTETKKAAAKKPAAKKPGRKPAAKKPAAAAKKTEDAAAKKTTAKKTETAAKKPGRKPGSKTSKKGETVIKTMVEFDGISVDVAAVQEKIEAKYVAEGHRVGAIKSFEIYINTAKKKAYYVINGKGGDDACVDLD